RVPDRRRRRARDRRALRGGRGCLPVEGPGARGDRHGDPAGRRRSRGVNLTAQNTAIVIDSTADFPEAPRRFANWRVVPLYVRFGDESRKDYVEIGPEEFYARLRTAADLPTTSQPTPGDFLAAFEELAGYDRIYSLPLSSK